MTMAEPSVARAPAQNNTHKGRRQLGINRSVAGERSGPTGASAPGPLIFATIYPHTPACGGERVDACQQRINPKWCQQR